MKDEASHGFNELRGKEQTLADSSYRAERSEIAEHAIDGRPTLAAMAKEAKARQKKAQQDAVVLGGSERRRLLRACEIDLEYAVKDKFLNALVATYGITQMRLGDPL